MIKQHLLAKLTDLSISEEQRQSILALLQEIQETPELLESFNQTPIQQTSNGSDPEECSTLSESQIEQMLIEADSLLEQGNFCETESSYKEAMELFNRALELYTKTSQTSGIIEVYIKIGTVSLVQGDLVNARSSFDVALQRTQDDDNILLKSDALQGLGNVFIAQDNHQKALEYFQQSLGINQQIGDHFRTEISLGNIGNVYRRLGQYETAIPYYADAIDIAQDIGNKRSEGNTLGNLGTVYSDLGQYIQACSCFEQAIEIAREIGNKSSECVFLGNLGVIHKEMGQYEQARQSYEQALEIANTIGNQRIEGILGNLGDIYLNIGPYEKAILYYSQALEISRTIGNKRSEGIFLGNLGEVYIQLNNFKEAEQHFTKAIQICQHSFPMAAGSFSGSLALVYSQKGRIAEALLLLKTAEPMVIEVTSEYGKFLCKKSQVLLSAGDTQQSKRSLEQAQIIAARLNVNADSEIGKLLAEAEHSLNNHRLS